MLRSALLVALVLVWAALAWEEKVNVEDEMTAEERRELDLEIQLEKEKKEHSKKHHRHHKKQVKLCKKGVAMTTADYLCDDMKVLTGVCWTYDWRLTFGLLKTKVEKNCTAIPNTHYVPMVFTYDPSEWLGYASFLTEDYNMISYNEPGRFRQANITPEDAAAGYKKQGNMVGPMTFMGSPSASACKQANKKCMMSDEDWFDKFFELCEDCKIDFMTAHHYSCTPGYTIRYLKKLHTRYQLPIWLTEFACFSTDPQEVKDYMTEMLEAMEVGELSDIVDRYAWYMSRITKKHGHETPASLLKEDVSELTPLGELYNQLYNED